MSASLVGSEMCIRDRGKGKSKGKTACLLCGKPGHQAEDCPQRGQDGTDAGRKRAFGSFAGMLSSCGCGQCEGIGDSVYPDGQA
eukprot:1413340-Alexandrium_andersonii.AAC.1